MSQENGDRSRQPVEDILASIRAIIVDGADEKQPEHKAERVDDLLSRQAQGLAAAAAPPASQHEAAPADSSGKTLEELTAELLRPMLRSWIDANMHDLVREMVAEEVRRLTRG